MSAVAAQDGYAGPEITDVPTSYFREADEIIERLTAAGWTIVRNDG